ncbi:MAG: hypothetical protein KIH64_010925 [Mycobacterium sp.]|nr:hypothetical protein [Mycobacterium sp.]
MAKEPGTMAPGVAGKLEWLRDSVKAHPEGAADSTWAWINDLSKGAKTDAAAADSDLNELFRLGTAPTDLHGATEGMLVMTTTNEKFDAVVRVITSMWMPWQGKRFDKDAAKGDNRLTKSTGLVGKLLWPLYKMTDHTDGKLAFDFDTYVEAGKEDPDVDVMVIDYAEIEKNPKLVIRKIRDELVELVPGVYLGKILYNTGSGYYRLGYFALRIPR